MAVYFDHRIEAPDSSGEAVLISWHSSLCVLAVGFVNTSTGGSVDLYLQQVRKHFHTCRFVSLYFSLCDIEENTVCCNLLNKE